VACLRASGGWALAEHAIVQAVAAIPTAGLLIGTALGLVVSDFPLFPGFAAVLLACAVAIWAWRTSRTKELTASVGCGFAAGGFVLAIDAWQSAWNPPLRSTFEAAARIERDEAARAGRVLPEDDSAALRLTATLSTDAAVRANGSVSLNLVVRRADLLGPPNLDAGSPQPSANPESPGLPEGSLGGVLLTVAGSFAAEQAEQWRAGRTIRVPAQLRRPSRYLDPGVPDEEWAMARRGITLVGVVKSAALVEVVARGTWLQELAGRSRAFARLSIGRAVGRWSPRSAAIVTAIVVGDRAGLDDQVERRLQEAGTYHVIAISGGNIAILAGLALVGFRVAGALGRAAMTSAIGALLAYAYLVGGSASVNRATLMAVVYLAARALDLRGPPANVLALSAGLLLAARPLAILDPGFVLTFGATAAILFAVPRIPARVSNRFATPFLSMLAASAAAECALLPVNAWLFSRVTFAGLAANLAAIPLMTVAQIAGMAAIPVYLVSPSLAGLIGWAAHVGAEGLVRSASIVDVAPFLTWRVAPPPAMVVVAYYLSLVVAWILWRRRARVVGSSEEPIAFAFRIGGLAVAAIAAIWIATGPLAAPGSGGDGRLHATFIDVGQGDAILLTLPRGSTLLVDTGGLGGGSAFDIGDRVVAPVLRQAGIRRIDSMVVTHGDLDHAGGALSLLREFRPRDVWEGIPVPPFRLLHDLREAARTTGARWINVQTGDLVSQDDVDVVVRHPGPADWERQDVRNDDSIVLEVLWRGASIVLTGDIGREVEREIAPLFAPASLRVVKVPHHGSPTSSSREFVRALAPQVAVFSVGRTNNFGHPSPDVVDRYREVGAQIFRTDQDGAITIDTDGTRLDIRTYTGQRVFVRGSSRDTR
jgi:competence protein ComEC